MRPLFILNPYFSLLQLTTDSNLLLLSQYCGLFHTVDRSSS